MDSKANNTMRNARITETAVRVACSALGASLYDHAVIKNGGAEPSPVDFAARCRAIAEAIVNDEPTS